MLTVYTPGGDAGDCNATSISPCPQSGPWQVDRLFSYLSFFFCFSSAVKYIVLSKKCQLPGRVIVIFSAGLWYTFSPSILPLLSGISFGSRAWARNAKETERKAVWNSPEKLI